MLRFPWGARQHCDAAWRRQCQAANGVLVQEVQAEAEELGAELDAEAEADAAAAKEIEAVAQRPELRLPDGDGAAQLQCSMQGGLEAGAQQAQAQMMQSMVLETLAAKVGRVTQRGAGYSMLQPFLGAALKASRWAGRGLMLHRQPLHGLPCAAALGCTAPQEGDSSDVAQLKQALLVVLAPMLERISDMDVQLQALTQVQTEWVLVATEIADGNCLLQARVRLRMPACHDVPPAAVCRQCSSTSWRWRAQGRQGRRWPPRRSRRRPLQVGGGASSCSTHST